MCALRVLGAPTHAEGSARARIAPTHAEGSARARIAPTHAEGSARAHIAPTHAEGSARARIAPTHAQGSARARIAHLLSVQLDHCRCQRSRWLHVLGCKRLQEPRTFVGAVDEIADRRCQLTDRQQRASVGLDDVGNQCGCDVWV
jgi:hypothetical protein